MSSAPDLPYPSRVRVQDEIARQHEILASGKWQRIVLAWCAFGLCTFYVNPLLIVCLAIIDTTAELINLRLLKDLDPKRQPTRYWGTLVCVVVIESTLGAAAGLIWQIDDPYSKALAAGMVMTAALQLTTVRSIHLPYGLCGIATLAVICLIAIWVHWSGHRDWFGLLITTATAAAGLTYAVIAMLSNHNLHRTTAEGRAAAWAADAAKTRFLAQMSHELRTPLNAIIGLAQIERDAATTARSRNRLSALVDSARGLARVLDDVLDLSAIGSGRFVLKPKGVDIRAELAMAVATFRDQATSQNLELTLECDESLPRHLRLDPQRMRQCLINLITNALKHVASGDIRLSARLNDTQPSLLQIDVADTGPGIPPNLRERVFEPFTTGGTAAPGSGLGLSIGRSLARQMGGDLVLLPSDTGATFRLTIAADRLEGPLPETAVTLPRLVGSTVLVVDDIATNRLVAASFLAATGTRVIEAGGGADALNVIAKDQVDLVLLDMNMPGMDGFETFRRIRAAGGRAARIPIIAMTAGVLPERRAEIAAAGLDGFLAKPLLPDELHAILINHLGQAAPQGQSPGQIRQDTGVFGHDGQADSRQGWGWHG
jgi:two-component system, sensor histidine kinase